MIIKSVGFKNFRSLKENKINTNSNIVVFKGNNGVGKTSILEAIYFCLTGSSFKTNEVNHMVNLNKNDFLVKLEIHDREEKEYLIESSYENKEKRFTINSKSIKNRTDLIYNFPCVVFSSEDIEFINGSPSQKRKFFDQVISLCDEEYLSMIKKYKNIITERNKLLKEENNTYFALYDEELAFLNEQIQIKRKEAIKSINSIIEEYYSIFFEEIKNLRIEYKPNTGAESRDVILKILQDNEEKDIERGNTGKGIHKDNFFIKNGHIYFEYYASKGQLRILSLLYRFAEIKYIYEKTQKKPFILIDDVFLELDKTRRKRFLNNIDNYSQMFLTFLPEEDYFDESHSNSKLVYNVENGMVTADE